MASNKIPGESAKLLSLGEDAADGADLLGMAGLPHRRLCGSALKIIGIRISDFSFPSRAAVLR